MKIMKLCLMTSLVLGLPFAAAAQQNVARATSADIEYCHALSRSYSYLWSTNEGMPVGEAFMLGQCDTDTQKTIATLEKRMKDQKIELPPRQDVAQSPGSTNQAPCSGAPTAEACTDGAP
jgi:hypothetical protein